MSAIKTGRWFMERWTITARVSMIGNPRIKRGNIGLRGDISFCVSIRERTPAENPMTWLPASPMKTMAG